MVSLVFLATFAALSPHPPSGPDSATDTSHARVTAQVRQEAAGNRSLEGSSEGGLFLKQETILDRMLTAESDPEKRAAAIDSLLKVHPELRELVLRTLLMPNPLPGFFAASPPSVSEAWRMVGNSRMTPFERSGMIMTRQMELHDRWTENRILAPQIDMIGTIVWLLGLFK